MEVDVIGPHTLIYFVAFQPYCLGRTTTYSPGQCNELIFLFLPTIFSWEKKFFRRTQCTLAFLWLLLEPFSPHLWAWDFLGSHSRHTKKVTRNWIWLPWSSQFLPSRHTTKQVHKSPPPFHFQDLDERDDLSHSIRANINMEISFKNLWGNDNTFSPRQFRQIIVKQFIYFQDFVFTMGYSDIFLFS